VISIVMSSADSFLNSASIAFINDIVLPLRRDPLPARSSLMLAKLVTFAVGVLSVLFALSIESIIDILVYAYTYWAPIVLVPLVAAVYRSRKGTAAFVAGAAAALVVATVWDYALGKPWQIEGLVVGVFANLIAFLAMPAAAHAGADATAS